MQDKIALVTGGGAGMGKAIAELLGREGAMVAVTDVDPEGAGDTAAAIRAEGGTAKAWSMDVSEELQVARVVQEVDAEWGRIDVLVNNAGIAGTDGRLHEISSSDWDKVFAVDVKGVFHVSKYVIPLMLRQGGGSIVNLSSVYGLVGGPELPAYHAAKGAVTLMTKNMAVSYGSDGIRVNSVHPGDIATPLSKELAAREAGGVEAYMERMERLHPIGHSGLPQDVAYAVLYLASDEAAFTTGLSMAVDGGYTAQ